MTNKIIEAALLADQYADAEYRRAWEEASDGPSWQQNRDARFYALARAEALEDAAKICESIAREDYGMTDLHEYGECAEAIRALKEQNAAIAAGKGEA